MSITQFTMEEVRCFGGRQTLEIRPLTFLVGENSTGKTTALACFHVLANSFRGKGVDFDAKATNLHPYSLGTFKDIVRNSKKKPKIFKLTFTSKYGNNAIEWIAEFIERKGKVQPTVGSVTIKFPNGEVVFKIDDSIQAAMSLAVYDEKLNFYQIDCHVDIFARFPLGELLYILDEISISSIGFLEGDDKGKIAIVNFLQAQKLLTRTKFAPWNIWVPLSVFSTSPIRSRPERTYDPMKEFNDPEGSDVPMLLMRLEGTKTKEWKALELQLTEFGKRSGLFQNLKIKKLGHSLSDPFKLQFKVRGPTSNIIDVGYGVSQILPILVQVLYPNISQRSRRKHSLPMYSLLQQPEVHLHPRAQAEFSSLLAKLANQGNQSFIVETHSDYMIDRARIEIRKGYIKPDDVSLIYFEPKGNIVKVHNIGFDKMGNLTNVPKHYRDFFLLESDRLLGFED